MTGGTGPAPGVVRVRLSGPAGDVARLAALLRRVAEGLGPAGVMACFDGELELIEQSAPYPNRREPGERVYLTLRITKRSQQ